MLSTATTLDAVAVASSRGAGLRVDEPQFAALVRPGDAGQPFAVRRVGDLPELSSGEPGDGLDGAVRGDGRQPVGARACRAGEVPAERGSGQEDRRRAGRRRRRSPPVGLLVAERYEDQGEDADERDRGHRDEGDQPRAAASARSSRTGGRHARSRRRGDGGLRREGGRRPCWGRRLRRDDRRLRSDRRLGRGHRLSRRLDRLVRRRDRCPQLWGPRDGRRFCCGDDRAAALAEAGVVVVAAPAGRAGPGHAPSRYGQPDRRQESYPLEGQRDRGISVAIARGRSAGERGAYAASAGQHEGG